MEFRAEFADRRKTAHGSASNNTAQSRSYEAGIVRVCRSVPAVGMVIAIENDMPVAKKLLEEIDAFGQRNPGHEKSVKSLVEAVRRIDTEFSGETREMPLAEARKTFLQQIRTLETSERTLEALQKLHSNQKALVTALKKLAVRGEQRPEGVTLH